MKRNKFLIVVLWFFSITAEGASLHLNVTITPDPPESGENSLRLVISDNAGPVREPSKVHAEFSMPAMGTMPAMSEKVDITDNGGGVFSGTFNLPMRGTWELKVSAETPSAQVVRNYSVTTGIPGLTNKDAEIATAQLTDTKTPATTTLLPIGPERLQRIGVRFADVEVRPLRREIRALGVVETDTVHRSDITLRFSGYIEKTFPVRVGDFVKKGASLFVVYSPELQNARNELLLDHKSQSRGTHVKALAVEKLRNLGIESVDLDELSTATEKRGWTIRAPRDGTVLALNAIAGTSFSKGQILCALGDLERNYIVARIFQHDLRNVAVGQKVHISIPDQDGDAIAGHVDLVFPNSIEGVGTSDVRIVADKPAPMLRPGSYVELTLEADLGDRLVVPTTAILYSGQRRYVFMDQGGGVLEPRQVRTGKSTSAWIEILSGVEAHARVVTHGMFLISSEAQLRSALPKWSGNGEEP